MFLKRGLFPKSHTFCSTKFRFAYHADSLIVAHFIIIVQACDGKMDKVTEKLLSKNKSHPSASCPLITATKNIIM